MEEGKKNRVNKKKNLEESDFDLFQCACGKGMRRNSLTTHWKLYCKFKDYLNTLDTPVTIYTQIPINPVVEKSV